MKAISLWQPWASLIACGAKPFETRSWAPPHELMGQVIAIHAAKKIDKDAAAFAQDLMYGQHDPGGFELAAKLEATMQGAPASLMGSFGMAGMPIGCVVCTAVLVGAFRLGQQAEGTSPPSARVNAQLTWRPAPDGYTVPYDDFGDYSPGRWAWLLADVRPFTPPVRAIGHQGFFELPQGWMTGAAA